MGTEQKFCEILKHDQGVKRPPRAGPASPPGTGYDQGVKRPPRAGPASPPGTEHDHGVKRPPRASPASPPGTGHDQGVKRPPRASPASPPGGLAAGAQGTAANVLGGAPMGGAGACIGKRAYKKRLNVYPDKASHISERLIDQMKVITAI